MREQSPPSYRWLLAGWLLLAMAGCSGSPREPSEPSKPEPSPLVGVTIRLAVVDDQGMVDAAAKLRGEWHARYEGRFEVDLISPEELAESKSLAADAIICSSGQLGLLAGRKLICPVPEPLRRSGSPAWSDVFELPKRQVVAWGQDLYAVPFGSPVLVCYYRADLLRRLGRRPPETWAEYGELARLLADHPEFATPSADGEETVWHGTVEPLGPGWAGLMLLARAAPYARHRDRFNALFDRQTMEPLIAGPPFVRALREMVAAARLDAADESIQKRLEFDPASAREAFWKGQCGMAVSWPTATADLSIEEPMEVRFVELPGSSDTYNAGYGEWDRRQEHESPHVPLLGIAGRIGVVSSASKHREAAFELLFWLSGRPSGPEADSSSTPRISAAISAASPAATLFRQSHLTTAKEWCEAPISDAAADQYGDVAQKSLSRSEWLFVPRIPGRSEYLAALDAAVQRVFRLEQPSETSLREAAEKWKEITERLGVEAQKTAYRRGLGE